jgi:hypothetical protein
MSPRFRSRYRDSVHYRERQDWVLEKEGRPATAPTYPAQLHELIGQPFCDGCKSWGCACACSECGKQTQALIGKACIACDDARTVAA